MSDSEDQNEPLLGSKAITPFSNGERLCRFIRRCLTFVSFHLIQVFEFLREKVDNTHRSRQQQRAATSDINEPEISRNVIPTESGIDVENSGQNPTDEQLTDRSVDPVIDEQVLRDSGLRIIGRIDSATTGPVLMVTTNGQTAPVLAPAYTNPPPARSPFHTDRPMPVALSYAGETEARVQEISQQIHNAIAQPNAPPPVFHAPQFQDEVSRVDGMGILRNIYRQASLVVVFLSAAYPDSYYCHDEWRTITDRFFGGLRRQEEKKRLVLVKFGDYNPHDLGLVASDFYIDGEKKNDKEVADIIISRWRKVEQLPT